MADAVQIRERGTRSIEDCRGDFNAIARLMESSWAENKQQPLLYGADFLESCFDYPGATLALVPTLYEGSEPLAFVAALPRRVTFRGRELRLAIITFLTVAKELKKSGYGIALWKEVVRRIRDAGFDGMVNYCVEGEAMNGMILGCCRMLQLPVTRALSIPYWSRLLPPKKVERELDAPNATRVEDFLALAACTPVRAPLSRLWIREEADWQCNRRIGAIVAQFQSGPRRGMLTGYIMPIANANRTQCLMVEDVLWGDLEPAERNFLVKDFLDRAVSEGAQVAALPILGYADVQPFHAARFRPSQRLLHAYLTVWNGEPVTDALPSLYLDVF